jgi:hypothetical protein
MTGERTKYVTGESRRQRPSLSPWAGGGFYRGDICGRHRRMSRSWTGVERRERRVPSIRAPHREGRIQPLPLMSPVYVQNWLNLSLSWHLWEKEIILVVWRSYETYLNKLARKLKRGEGTWGRRDWKELQKGLICSEYIMLMYGNTTMKSFSLYNWYMLIKIL